MADKQRIEELSAAVRYHRDLYYNHSAPEISDADFDKLWDELKLLDPNNSVLHEVGPEPLPGTEKVEHMFPMRSLDKGTTDEDIIHFVTQSTFGGKRYLAQPNGQVEQGHARQKWADRQGQSIHHQRSRCRRTDPDFSEKVPA